MCGGRRVEGLRRGHAGRSSSGLLKKGRNLTGEVLGCGLAHYVDLSARACVFGFIGPFG